MAMTGYPRRLADAAAHFRRLDVECEHAQVDTYPPELPGGITDWRCRECGQSFVPVLPDALSHGRRRR